MTRTSEDDLDHIDMTDIRNRAHALSGGIMSVKHACTDFRITPAEFWMVFDATTVMRGQLIAEIRVAADALRKLEEEFVRQERQTAVGALHG